MALCRRGTQPLDIEPLHIAFWHIADVPLTLTHVCFEGKKRHDADETPFPQMTQSGHLPISDKLTF
jgi:hypothetical protein